MNLYSQHGTLNPLKDIERVTKVMEELTLAPSTKGSGISEVRAKGSGESFNDKLLNGVKGLGHDIVQAGHKAEAMTYAAANGQASELELALAVNNLEENTALGTEIVKKLIDSYNQITRMLG